VKFKREKLTREKIDRVNGTLNRVHGFLTERKCFKKISRMKVKSILKMLMADLKLFL